jgi:hypothetical protein
MADSLCVLYGCSVPVVLRKLSGPNTSICWQLVGDSYLHGIMDGEALRYGLQATPQCIETEFELRKSICELFVLHTVQYRALESS